MVHEVVVPMQVQHLVELRSDSMSLEELTRSRSQVERIIADFVTNATDAGSLRTFFRAFAEISRDWPCEFRNVETLKLKRVFQLTGHTVLDPTMLDPQVFSGGAKTTLKMLAAQGLTRGYKWIEPDFPEQLALLLW